MSNGTSMVKADQGVTGLNTFLGARSKSLAAYAASRTKPDVLIKLALLEFSQSEWLRKCTPETIYASLITAAQLGLEPGAAKGEAYLVPFRGKCQLIPGYRGLIKMALRSKAVKSVYSHVVYEADEFMLDLGSEPRVVHRPALDGDRGAIRGAYAVAQMTNGAVDVEWMSVVDLEKIRADAARGRGGNDGPYKDHESEMYRKAPTRRLCKRLPMGDDFFKATLIDEHVEAGKDVPRLDLDTPIEDADVIEQPGSLRDKVSRAAGEPA